MASDVLAVIFVSVVLAAFAYASVHTDKAFAQVEYDIINDTASFPWQDLRNEIHQGDAITYELGKPQYKILNADEPLEIITPDQPGYYESLKRYEAAAKQQAEDTQSDATTTPPDGTKEQTENPKDKQLPIEEKKIHFIILKSKKKSKIPKIYLDVTNKHQQDATPGETCKNNTKIKSEASYIIDTETEWRTQQLIDDSEAQSKGEKKEDDHLLNNLLGSKQNQSASKSNGTKYAVKPFKPLKNNSLTPNNIMNNSSLSALPYMAEESVTETPQKQALPATEKPQEAPLQLPPVFLTYNPSTTATQNQKPKEPYANGTHPSESTYEAPPHIRDFEYLYRSALGLR